MILLPSPVGQGWQTGSHGDHTDAPCCRTPHPNPPSRGEGECCPRRAFPDAIWGSAQLAPRRCDMRRQVDRRPCCTERCTGNFSWLRRWAARLQRPRVLHVHTSVNCNLWLFYWTYCLQWVVFGHCRIRKWVTMADDLPRAPWGPSAEYGFVCGWHAHGDLQASRPGRLRGPGRGSRSRRSGRCRVAGNAGRGARSPRAESLAGPARHIVKLRADRTASRVRVVRRIVVGRGWRGAW